MLRFVYYRWASKLTYLLRLNHETLKYILNKDMNKECSKDSNESCIYCIYWTESGCHGITENFCNSAAVS